MANLSELLEKTADWDKDERYMATLDICTELGKDGRQIDGSLELGTSLALPADIVGGLLSCASFLPGSCLSFLGLVCW